MKKTVWAMALSLAALLASCDTSDDPGGDGGKVYPPLPDGVYIAGVNGKGQACYWVGGNRTDFDVSGAPESISVSEGKVLVSGSNTAIVCYWADGTRYESLYSGKVVISEGKIYQFVGGKIFIDGVKINKDDGYIKTYDMAVSGGTIYLSGLLNSNAGYYIYTAGSSYGSFRSIHRNTEEFTFIPGAITVTDDGKMFIIGYDSDPHFLHTKAWYYTDREFYELEGFGEYDWIKRVAASGDSFFVYRDHHPKTDAATEIHYWVDGRKVTIALPGYYNATDFTISGGKIYVTGFYLYQIGDANQSVQYSTQACYWVDGERYDLDGSSATAIFVEE